tara:strand:- start:192 stop:458 length:267 start_codon:yes stop_codon:yes gene_type:complete
VAISITPKDQDRFSVTVTNSATTTHIVTISDEAHSKLTGGKISKEKLLEKSFEFLLQREPNTSILAKFKLEVISQYFPDFGQEVSTWK